VNQSFQEALAEFHQFLARNGHPQEVIWVKPDDVILTGGPLLYVRVQASRGNEESARQLFESGISRQMGVLFGTLCEIDGATCSYVWVPKDETESQQALMPTGLKMSVHSENSRVRGKAVRNPLHWSYFRLKYRKKQESKKQLFQ
jgi:hypothetical protein